MLYGEIELSVAATKFMFLLKFNNQSGICSNP